MKIKITPKKIFFKNFPEFKGRKIEFIQLSTDENCSGGYRAKVGVIDAKNINILDFTIDYFNIVIRK